GFFGPYDPPALKDKDQNQTGLYAAVNVNDKSGFNLELGNRMNIHSENGSKYVFNINPSYLLKKQFKLFANLSSGYRIPSLYQLFSEYGNIELEPESSITAEAGLQFFSVDNKFMGRVTGFMRNMKDVIAFQTKYVNLDKQKDHGA